eukprot:jgi/Ulvmu1/379/UM001_0386.1
MHPNLHHNRYGCPVPQQISGAMSSEDELWGQSAGHMYLDERSVHAVCMLESYVQHVAMQLVHSERYVPNAATRGGHREVWWMSLQGTGALACTHRRLWLGRDANTVGATRYG